MKSRKTRRLKKRLSHKKVRKTRKVRRKTRKVRRKKRKTLRKKRKTLRKKQKGGANKEEEEEEKDCAICLGELHNGTGEYTTDCNHTFHYRCIKRWEVVNGQPVTCPMCRAPIRTPFFPTRGTETVIYPDGETYEGEWKDGQKHGQGKYTYTNGTTYKGEFKDGKKHGKGKYTYADGRTYEGEWKDGKKHGKGKNTYADGRTYEGDWKDGKRHGQGKYTYADGGTYEGECKDGTQHGEGKFTYPDGRTYEGDWENGKKHGSGVETIDGKDKFALWEYDTFKEELSEKLICEMCCFRQKDISCSSCGKIVGCVGCCQKIHNDKCPNCRDKPWIPRKVIY